MSESDSKETPKQRGRPKKKEISITDGVHQEPKDSRCIFELYSKYISIFKKLSEILKELSQESFYIKFNNDGMCICVRGKKIGVYKIFINAQTSTHYFISKETPEVYIPLTRAHLEQIFKYVENDAIRIDLLSYGENKENTIAIQYASRTTVNNLPHINMPATPIDGTDFYVADKYDFLKYNKYQLTFDLNTKTLKSIIDRAGNRDIFIIKEPKNHLIIKCNNHSDAIAPIEIFTDPTAINMQSLLKPDQTLQIIIKSTDIEIGTNSCITFTKIARISISDGQPVSIKWMDIDDNGREIYSLHMYI